MSINIPHLPDGRSVGKDKYKITRFIGFEHGACVYEAENILMESKVIIKEFFIDGLCVRCDDGSVTVALPDHADRASTLREAFLEGARQVYRLQHDGIERVLDIINENGTSYVVSESVEGESLQNIIDRKGNLPEATVLRYVAQVMDALEEAHSKGVLHLNITPANIIIDGEDNAVLVGFCEWFQSHGNNVFTPGYSPVELLSSKAKPTAAADIYALGATIYAAITGQTPPSASEIAESPSVLKPLPPGISFGTKSTVAAMMQTKQNLRPQSIQQARAALFRLNPEGTATKAYGSDDDSAKSNVPDPLNGTKIIDSDANVGGTKIIGSDTPAGGTKIIGSDTPAGGTRIIGSEAAKLVKKKKKKKILAWVFSILAVLLAIGGGAYAWTMYKSHKELQAEQAQKDSEMAAGDTFEDIKDQCWSVLAQGDSVHWEPLVETRLLLDSLHSYERQCYEFEYYPLQTSDLDDIEAELDAKASLAKKKLMKAADSQYNVAEDRSAAIEYWHQAALTRPDDDVMQICANFAAAEKCPAAYMAVYKAWASGGKLSIEYCGLNEEPVAANITCDLDGNKTNTTLTVEPGFHTAVLDINSTASRGKLSLTCNGIRFYRKPLQTN